MANTCLNCPSITQMTPFLAESFSLSHAGVTARVEGLSGRRCDACGEVEFDDESARRYAAAGDALVIGQRECGFRDDRATHSDLMPPPVPN